jgi:hypothetical protein
MAFPPKPPPLTTHPNGKPGVPDQLVENARRAKELARAEAGLSARMQGVIRRMTVDLPPTGSARADRRNGPGLPVVTRRASSARSSARTPRPW